MKPELRARTFALILLCLHISQAQNSSLTCDAPPPRDQSQSPQFLCDVQINVVRNPDCSATITERYLFPYTTGRDAFRLIPLIKGQQLATDVVAMRGNRIVFNESRLQSESGSSGAEVTLPTLQRNQSVLFTVQYVLTAAVTRFTAQCDGETEVPPENERVNVIRWRTGSWEPTFERMNVSFVTDNRNASFSVASAPNGQVIASSTRNSTTIMWLDVSTAGAPIEVLVAERGTQQCPQELECFPGRGLSTGIIVVIVLASTIPFLCIVFFICRGGSGGRYGSSYVGGDSGGGGGGGCGGGGGGG